MVRLCARSSQMNYSGSHMPYASIDFANWQGYTSPLANATDWNVTSGRYAKASYTRRPDGNDTLVATPTLIRSR
jgi:hypothetical protein